MYGIHAASSPKHSCTRRSPSAVPASTLMPSGWVWWTCGAGTNAGSRVSIEQRGAHRGEVAAGPLDPHDRDLAAGVVARRALGGGVAAAEVRDGAVGAQEV